MLAIAVALVLGAHGTARAHASLLSSEPAAGSTLASPPPRLRLVFSEELEPTLGRLALEDGAGHVTRLAAAGDPHDVHALVAPLDSLAPGAYRVIWRVVSADGHPVQGSFVFHVAAPTAPNAAAGEPPPLPGDESAAGGGMPSPTGGPMIGDAPLVASLLRGLGVGALMALGGLLFYMVADRRSDEEERQTPPPERASRVAGWLSAAAPLLLALHLLAWAAHTSPTGALDSAWLGATLGTAAGRVELARVLLALLACWALLLARRPGVALTFVAVGLLVSGAIGHPAAVHPAWSVPAKAVHLLAGGAWLGGIVWILTLDRDDDAIAFAARVDRVSAVALAAVVAVTLSGVVQAWLFLAAPADLVRSAYGLVVLAKAAGLLALAAFGAHYRGRVIARIASDAAMRRRFHRLLGRELALMTAVVLLGGLLAYLAPPSAATPMAEMHHHSPSD